MYTRDVDKIRELLVDLNYRLESLICNGGFWIIPRNRDFNPLLEDIPIGILYKNGSLEFFNDFDSSLKLCHKEIRDFLYAFYLVD